MPTYETGPVTNVNAFLQGHLNQGGRLELLIQRDGRPVLELLPSEEAIESLKQKLEGN